MSPRIAVNSVSLAGEFAVLSQLALWGFDANMTLGNTKNVDILVSDPTTNKLYQLEVKTCLRRYNRPPVSKLFGRFLCDWIMSAKHETIARPELWYCFVWIDALTKAMRFFIVPSSVVAAYVRAEHKLWLDVASKHKTGPMRLFRMGMQDEKYKIPTPFLEQYENNWGFHLSGKNGDKSGKSAA